MQAPQEQFSLINLTHSTVPDLPYHDIMRKILGNTYELSVACIGRTRARRLNKELRNKDKVANVLSFPLSKQSGEITLCLEKIKSEAKKFNHSYKQHTAFLFIHGLLHLKGMEHGSTMEREEQKMMRAYNLT